MKSRKPAAPVSKPHTMNPPHLPPCYDELIETEHLVRVVSRVIDEWGLVSIAHNMRKLAG